jgi:hypothetical protein
MSIVRDLAVWIADFIVRHAAPGSREWSEALGGEIRFIESDWRALAWALSGVRVLFTRPQVPLRTFEELGAAAQKYADARRQQANRSWLDRNLIWMGPMLVDAFFIHKTHGAQRLGWVFFALIPVLANLLSCRRGHAREIPEHEDLQGMILFYRQGLENISRVSAWRFWFVPIVVSLLCGWGLAMRTSSPLKDLLAVLCLSIVTLFLRQQQQNRRRLAQIDALLDMSRIDEPDAAP